MISSCPILPTMFFGEEDDTPTKAGPCSGCRIKRSDRPCLVCPARMDLVEVSQALTLFWLPLCNLQTLDVLDCPVCGFKTSLDSYDYLQICRADSSVSHASTRASIEEEPEEFSHCSKCRCEISSHWQYCPTCGEKNMFGPGTCQEKADVLALQDLTFSMPENDHFCETTKQ